MHFGLIFTHSPCLDLQKSSWQEKNIFWRMTSDATYLWVCDKTIFRIGMSTQRKLTNEKTRILSKILRFSWQEQIQKIKLFKYYTKRKKNYIRTKLSSLGQEPTFKWIYHWQFSFFFKLSLTVLERTQCSYETFKGVFQRSIFQQIM